MTYNWKKGGLKFLIVFAEVVVAGALIYVTERPELIVLVPILEFARNWIKHR
ncbi:MAG TPA: hypothetical protein VJ110_01610 [Candidatus Nanoarchaeia archaeon]|nr:hypothetical protein [Candidatus Nanoarchaeia archaeon]